MPRSIHPTRQLKNSKLAREVIEHVKRPKEPVEVSQELLQEELVEDANYTLQGRSKRPVQYLYARSEDRAALTHLLGEFAGCYIAQLQGDGWYHLRVHWTGKIDRERLYDLLALPIYDKGDRTASHRVAVTLDRVLSWARRDQLSFGGEMLPWFERNEEKIQAAYGRLEPKKMGRPKTYANDIERKKAAVIRRKESRLLMSQAMTR